ncbi:MAG TPA: HDOD domain-containing protein [Bryobacteraceae bacterium]|nr:HDOD domain-containing protein [Bryobacteraceae bacterium]
MVQTPVGDPEGIGVPPDRLCKLPVFRPVAIRLLSVLAQEDVEISEVTGLLNSDPAFIAEILTLSNSSLYARQTRIDTVQRAIMCLGLERTRAFAATVALHGMVCALKSKDAVQDCWQHSRAAAIIAEWLAPFWRLHPEQSYTAALMHDIGRLGMLSAYPDYPNLLATATGSPHDLLAREQSSFSVNHCQAGMWLTRIWGLPEEFGAAASQHHEPLTATPSDRVDLIRFSCAFAESMGFKPATKVDCVPVEDLVARIPDTVLPRSRFSLDRLSDRLWKELQADAEA